MHSIMYILILRDTPRVSFPLSARRFVSFFFIVTILVALSHSGSAIACNFTYAFF